jgi:two-component system chemotaxis response regulator CheB
MGADGAEGLLRIREAGGRTFAQDQATSIVWGMPGEAVKRGAAEEVLPLDRIAERILQEASRDALVR